MKRVKKPVFFIVAILILALTYTSLFGVYGQFGDFKTTYIKGAEDKEGTRSAKGMAKFALFAFLGLLCGAIVQFLGYMTCIEWSGWGINILDIDFSTLFGSDVLVFWSYTVVFVLKTAATTIFNYVTRKFILYKTKTV